MGTCAAIGVGLLVLFGVWLLGPALFSLPAVKAGEYQTALRWSGWLRWCLGGELSYAVSLLHAGELGRAEEVLRAQIEHNGRGWHTLAYVHLHQGRIREAKAAAHHAIAAEPEMDLYRTTLVEISLVEGLASPALWRHLEAAAEQGEAPGLTWFAPGLLAEIESLRAWLHGLLGEHRAAEEAITRALQAAEPFPFVQADTHWRVAMAWRALGDLGAAQRHLEIAAEVDPDGIHGRRARASLAEAAGELTIRD